jgi:hypothetical protein
MIMMMMMMMMTMMIMMDTSRLPVIGASFNRYDVW